MNAVLTPLFSVEDMASNPGLRMQCGMMLDEFPSATTKSIEDARDDLAKIAEIISASPPAMIDGYFTKIDGRNNRVSVISSFIHTFFAHRRTLGK